MFRYGTYTAGVIVATVLGFVLYGSLVLLPLFMPNRLFVHASEAFRIAETRRAYELDEAAARDLIRTSDKRRSHFVQLLLGRPWGDACLFDLTVDSSPVGLERASAIVTAVMQDRINARR